MIKPDWNIFKAKFSENHQSNFEWFCYLLFCQEYDKSKGIFRCKNQSAIETNPVLVDGQVIGFQAKFYDTTLSTHKEEIINSIEKSKRDYTNITKIIFYTNQEWGQGKKQNDPIAKIEAEQKAKDLCINIEWRTASFFESPFVAINNMLISKQFFSLDKSMINFYDERRKHTELILFEIKTDIDFNNKKIKINRNEIKNDIQNELKSKQILILSGVGGTGKTAIIKEIYEIEKENTPFYIFKANEFNINNINELFNQYELNDIIEFHKNEEMKIAVIDSAEKLLELKNTDPFKEFFQSLITNSWKIIFTTRNNYLEDLNYQFLEIYNIIPFNININNLCHQELINLSTEFDFLIPDDEKLLELIKNPFYLNEFLRYYREDEISSYIEFKEKLWNKTIKKSLPIREKCFLDICFLRATEGNFYVMPSSNNEIYNELRKDGVLGHEISGYFITHDIYEEWALEKVIETQYIQKNNNNEMLYNIGTSLPIRRSFRNWISEKLLLNDDIIIKFIEEIINDRIVSLYWKDEVFISILLSDYSEIFFNKFKNILLEDNYQLLRRLVFLTRIACKEVDNRIFVLLGQKYIDFLSAKYIFTKPKGKGWEYLIKFSYENIETIAMKDISFILPLIYEWNEKSNQGETTRFSSLIALEYYNWTIKEHIYFSQEKDMKEKLFQTILSGSNEIRVELIKIFDEVLEKKWKNHRDPYNDFIEYILSKSLNNVEIIKSLPTYVISLANLFWERTPKQNSLYESSSIGVEKYFGLEDNHHDYFPSSSFQTPIYWLLQYSFKETIQFILSFTNSCVENFANTEFAKNEIEEIDVFIEAGKSIKQYIGNRIWNMYRGTQVNPHVLESMHMAFEKHLLFSAKDMKTEILEDWLLYLIKNAKSASITAIVVSIVLAFPEKTFNVAKVLFKTREFFIYDKHREHYDNCNKNIFSIGYGLSYKDKIHQDERLETFNDVHRKKSLENIALHFQLFKSESIDEEEFKNRQQIVWNILDNYYKLLETKSNNSEINKVWRLFLARMDRRKMTPSIEKINENIVISLNPQLDDDLKVFSETSEKKSFDLLKYLGLQIWSDYRIKNNEKCKDYEQYENNPQLVIKEIKEIIQSVNSCKDKDFNLLNHAIPAQACSVLIRDFFDKLSDEDKTFCKDIVLETAYSSVSDNYAYQISDGVEESILVLPLLLNDFPNEKVRIKTILLLTLFDPTNIGMYCEFSDYSKNAILNYLWKLSFEDAKSLLFGYLYLKPKYDETQTKIMQNNYNKGIYKNKKSDALKQFLKKSKKDIEKVICNKLSYTSINNIEMIDLFVLKTAFQLIPNKTDNKEIIEIAQKIITVFAKNIMSEKREDKIDYNVKIDFLKKYVYLTLFSAKEDIENYLKPFVEFFNITESVPNLLKEFIFAEDSLATYENFWYVWNQFDAKFIEYSKKEYRNWHLEDSIKSFLFASVPWKENAKEWHALKEREKEFFKNITENLGNHFCVLHSISKLLNDIGSKFLNDGVIWISKMIKNNPNLLTDELDMNTLFYLENLIRKYIYLNREEIRRTKQLKQDVIVILNFLVEKSSVIGYILRENIL